MALVLLAVLAAVQLGFQLTVTLVVYPTLADTRDEDWTTAHDRHSRRIAVPVVLLYGGLVAAVPAAWASAEAAERSWVAAGAVCLVMLLLTTAVLAAPTHGRLGREPAERRPLLLRRLHRVDRARLAWSVALAGCAAGALLVRT